jgi:hypothetical protein
MAVTERDQQDPKHTPDFLAVLVTLFGIGFAALLATLAIQEQLGSLLFATFLTLSIALTLGGGVGSVAYYWCVTVDKQSATKKPCRGTLSTDPARNQRPNPATITTRERFASVDRVGSQPTMAATAGESNHDGSKRRRGRIVAVLVVLVVAAVAITGYVAYLGSSARNSGGAAVGRSSTAPASASPTEPPGQSRTTLASICSPEPVTVPAGGEVDLSCIGEAQFVTPARWKLKAVSRDGGPCDLGLASTPLTPGRSTHGTDILIHGRDAGPHMIRTSTACTVTVFGQDDRPVTLPVHIAPTSQSGASPLFHAHGLIRVATSGPPKCNATLFDDTTAKAGHQAIPQAPLDINVNGTYFVVAEQNDCAVDVTQLS